MKMMTWKMIPSRLLQRQVHHPVVVVIVVPMVNDVLYVNLLWLIGNNDHHRSGNHFLHPYLHLYYNLVDMNQYNNLLLTMIVITTMNRRLLEDIITMMALVTNWRNLPQTIIPNQFLPSNLNTLNRQDLTSSMITSQQPTILYLH